MVHPFPSAMLTTDEVLQIFKSRLYAFVELNLSSLVEEWLEAQKKEIQKGWERIEKEKKKLESDRRQFELERKEFEKEKKAFEFEKVIISDAKLRNGEVMPLNVGGQPFDVTKSTLCSVKDSMLEVMFSGRHELKKDVTGRYFIDRDPSLFGMILNFLRSPGRLDLPEDPSVRSSLLVELDFYQLPLSLVRGFDKYLFVIGGRTGESAETFLSSVEYYDFGKKKWEVASDMSTKRGRCTAVEMDGKIFVIGGFNGSSYLETVEYYDPQLKSWFKTTAMSTKRFGCAAASVSNFLFVVGGCSSGSNYLSSAEYLDIKNPGKWVSIQDMSTKRYGCASAVVENKLYVVGGYSGTNYLETMECFDLETNCWVAFPDMTSKRYGCAATIFDDKLFVIGGYNGCSYLETVEYFDFVKKRWVKVPNMSTKRFGCSTGVLNGKLFVLGGFEGTNNLELVEYFDPITDRWEKVSDWSIKRFDFAATTVNAHRKAGRW